MAGGVGVIYSGVTPLPRLGDEEAKSISASQNIFSPDGGTVDGNGKYLLASIETYKGVVLNVYF